MSKKIIINENENPFWSSVATTLAGQEGVVVSESTSDAVTSYNAEFAIYGAVFGGIPAEFCTVRETDGLSDLTV